MNIFFSMHYLESTVKYKPLNMYYKLNVIIVLQ